LDNSYKSILVDPKQTTIEELWEIVCEKIEILPLNRRCFFIWGFGESLRLLLYSDDTIETVLKDWPDYENKYCKHLTSTFRRKRKSNAPPRLFFRTTDVLARDHLEESLQDPASLRLHYVQAVKDVVNGDYPVQEDNAIELAGIQLQVLVGDRIPSKHKAGYLMGGKDKAIHVYAPERLAMHWLRDKKRHAEPAILREWSRHVGQNRLDLMRQYIAIVKQFKSFGSTFFKVTHVSSTSQVFQHKFEGQVSLGISQSGLHVLDKNTDFFAGSNELITHIPFSAIKSWGHDEKFFWYKLKDEEKGQTVFGTGVGEVISTLMGQWGSEIENYTMRMQTLMSMTQYEKGKIKPRKRADSRNIANNNNEK